MTACPQPPVLPPATLQTVTVYAVHAVVAGRVVRLTCGVCGEANDWRKDVMG